MSAEREGRARAEAYRTEHHLGTQPLGDLVALIDLLDDLDVAVIRSPDTEAHGLTVVDPNTGVTMLIAVATPNPMRLRSTIAHELGHHLFGDSAPADNDWLPQSREETRATAFARHLLLPLAALPDVLGEPNPKRPVTQAHVSALVQRFAVSPQMAVIQLREGNYIGARQKSEWMVLTTPSLATRHGWANLYGAWRADSQAIRPPQRLLARAIDGYSQGLVSLETIARLEGITPDAARAALDDADVTVTPPTATPLDGTDLPEPEGGMQAIDAFEAEFGTDD